jgi:hypothetical protein
MEVDIYSTQIGMTKRRRRKKRKESAPKQRNLNDKNAKRYFVQLVLTNFSKDDLHVSLTYANEPETIEAAEEEARNFIRRVNYRRKKEGLPPAKYIIVTEKGSKGGRLHHHILLSGDMDRDVIESLWSKTRKKGQKAGEKIGLVRTDRLQPNEKGLEEIANYLGKDNAGKNQKGKKRWIPSKNLTKPEYSTNDSKYTRRQVERIVQNEIDNNLYWAKQYPGWDLADCKPVYNELTGWSIYLKLRRFEE